MPDRAHRQDIERLCNLMRDEEPPEDPGIQSTLHYDQHFSMNDAAGPSPHLVTQLLVSWSKGDSKALEQLIPLVEGELHRLALHYILQEQPGNSLQPTALINEAYLRLIDWRSVEWQSRVHFFSVAAKMMRRILVNSALRRKRRLVDGPVVMVSLASIAPPTQERSTDLVLLDQALGRLAEFDERKALIVNHRYFGGLTTEEIADLLGISTSTVDREWRITRAWLFREITGKEK